MTQNKKLVKKIRAQEKSLALLIGSRRFVYLADAYERTGNLEAMARFCNVTLFYLKQKINFETGRVYDPVAGCLKSVFNRLSLYVEGENKEPILFKDIK